MGVDMRQFLLTMALVVGTALTGCQEPAIRAPRASGDRLDAAVEPSGAPVALGAYTEGPCATPGDVTSFDELVGTWSFIESRLYDSGPEPTSTQTTGEVAFSANGRWEGEWRLVLGAGNGTDPVTSGPGDWSFESGLLTMHFDDGSDALAYPFVRISEMVDNAGVHFLVLSLEGPGPYGCTAELLQRPL